MLSGQGLDVKGGLVLCGSWRDNQQLEMFDLNEAAKVCEFPLTPTGGEQMMVYTCQFTKGMTFGSTIAVAGSGVDEIRFFDAETTMKP